MEDCTYTGENVITQYKQHREVVDYLITCGISAISSNRCDIIFNPYPKYWDTVINDLGLKMTTGFNNLVIPKIIEKLKITLDIKIILKIIQESYTDKEIIEKLDIHTYGLIKFILMSNKIFIKPYSLLTQEDIITIDSKKDFKDNINLENELKQFKVIHTPLKEEYFKGKETMFLFHGTPFENGYSIMVNDIKIGSKSKYFLNGDSYGTGIYLSNEYSLSLGYSDMSLDTKKFSDKRILFIFEVLKNEKNNNWKKTDNIFVVNDENALILRYILYFSNSSRDINNIIFKAINIKLNTGKLKQQEQKQIEMEVKNISVIRQKRIMREYSLVTKGDPNYLGFRVKLKDDSNINIWYLEMFRVDNEKLQKQMSKLGIECIQMEIIFKDNYPFEPPFIRIISPHFIERKGHITTGGSFCVDILTTQKWSSANSIETLMTALKLIMLTGDAEIDETKKNKIYNLDEAVDAFNRALKAHNWV